MRPRPRRESLPTASPSVACLWSLRGELSGSRRLALGRCCGHSPPPGPLPARFGSPARRTRGHGDSAGVVVPGETPPPAGFVAGSAPADGQRVEAVDAVDRAVLGVAVEGEARHARAEEGERLLELGAREVGAEAVVDAGAERQRLAAPL